jgi:hypothetical protein
MPSSKLLPRAFPRTSLPRTFQTHYKQTQQLRPLSSLRPTPRTFPALSPPHRRPFHTTPPKSQPPPEPNSYYPEPQPSHRTFYRIYSRAIFKAFTLAFLTYQIVYWYWLTIESDEERDELEREIKGLEGAVRLLSGQEGRHGGGGEKRLLEEGEGRGG